MILPLVGVCTPVRILMSVDLPAPLSPNNAITSARATSKSTSSRAVTRPNFLTMFSLRLREFHFRNILHEITTLLNYSIVFQLSCVCGPFR